MQKSTSKNLKNLQNENYKCDHCGKVLKTEKGFYNHMCKKKKRWAHKDEINSKKAFQIFVLFNNFLHKTSKVKTLDNFLDSQFYDYFINLSNFLMNGFVALPEKYCEYIFKNNINMKLWDKYETYEKFLLDLYKVENPSIAIERTLNFIGKWAEEREEAWVDFFKKITPSLALDWILYGRISPWILFCDNCYFGNHIFSRITDEQLNIIAKIIDPVIWDRRLTYGERKIADYIEMLKEQGM